MMIHKKTGIKFQNRKEAKAVMGCIRYQKAVQNGDFEFINKETDK